MNEERIDRASAYMRTHEPHETGVAKTGIEQLKGGATGQKTTEHTSGNECAKARARCFEMARTRRNGRREKRKKRTNHMKKQERSEAKQGGRKDGRKEAKKEGEERGVGK